MRSSLPHRTSVGSRIAAARSRCSASHTALAPIDRLRDRCGPWSRPPRSAPRIGRLRKQDVDPSFRQCPQVFARSNDRLIDRLAIGMVGESVGQDQRRDALRPGGVHRHRHNSAEREAADMRALDSELGHRRKDDCSIIVARHAFVRRVAVAVARIIERDRTPLALKWSSCGRHTDLSEPTP